MSIDKGQIEFEGYACGDETNDQIARMVQEDGNILFLNGRSATSRDGAIKGRLVHVTIKVRDH